MRGYVMAGLLLCVPVAGHCSAAAAAAAGRVARIASLADGIVVFEQAGERTAVPACVGAGSARRWAFDGASAAGAVVLQALLDAEAMNLPVAVVGTGACPAGIDVERLGALQPVAPPAR